MTNPSHTKDFKEAAEQYAFISMYACELDFEAAKIDFEAGANHGYAEAMKEQRAFAIWYSGMTADKVERAYQRFLREKPSFTEQEQSNTKDNGS
jgi:hypothetical protein